MINLLPPKEKQILLKEKHFREVLILGIVIFLCFSFFSLLLFLIQVDLKSRLLLQRTILEEKEKELEISEIKSLEEEVESVNQSLLKLNSFYQDSFYLTDILEDLSETVPPDLYLTNLSYSTEKKEISLFGFSSNRETLSKFKANLREKENFKEVYFPPSNWLEPTDIDFFASFKIAK